MRRTLLTLALASACLALPSPQQHIENLHNLILKAFDPAPTAGPGPAPQTNATPSAFSSTIGNFSNEDLLHFVIHTQQPTTDCVCVPYYQCVNRTIKIDENEKPEPRIGSDVVAPRACEKYLDVCCNRPDMVKVEDKVTPPPLERKGCGYRHPQGIDARITGNSNSVAQFAEFPWMVVIMKENTIDGKNKGLHTYQCGGSLIHRQAVLTAAHCVSGKQPSELRIRAGEWDAQTKVEIHPHQDRAVRSVIVHEKYFAGTLLFDVAILILSEPVDYADNVDIVCLPERDTVYDGTQCFASGWGKDSFGKKGLYQFILKKVELPVMPRDTCQDSLRKTRLGKYFELHESFICAGGEVGKDTCKGDGGSPLVCPSINDPTRYQQAGIVAWGIGCGNDGTPGVYASVAHVRDWIDEQMAFNGLDNRGSP